MQPRHAAGLLVASVMVATGGAFAKTAAAAAALGNDDPSCNSTGFGFGFTAQAGGSPVPPGTCLVPGQPLTYCASLFVPTLPPPLIACAVCGGQLCLTLPDGTIVPLAGYPDTPPIPCLDPGEGLAVCFDGAYIVDPADGQDGVLEAQLQYLGGEFQSDPPVPASGIIGKSTLLCAPEIAAAIGASPEAICPGVETEVTLSCTVTNPGDAVLAGVEVTADACGPFAPAGGDDGDGLLQPGETWTLTCTTTLLDTTTVTTVASAMAVASTGEPVPEFVYEATAAVTIGADPADVTDDGVTDVLDLIEVVLAWGPCPGSCPADTDGNGIVDVDDLIAVVLGWGPCG